MSYRSSELFIFFILSLLPAFSYGIDRISEQEMDRSKPMSVNMTPGRSTTLLFPCDISHSIKGLSGDVKTTIGPDDKKSMSLWLSSEASQTTNLTVKCDGEFYVFDIEPSRFSHQDILEISYSFDTRARMGRKLIASSEVLVESDSIKKTLIATSSQPRALELSEKELIASSADQIPRKVTETTLLKALNKNAKMKRFIRRGTKK